MYKLLKQEGNARRGEFTTVHGTVQTPAFMNVATCAAIKGGVDAYDLNDLKCQVMLSNTYHLHLRPGDELVKKLNEELRESYGNIMANPAMVEYNTAKAMLDQMVNEINTIISKCQ